MLHTLRLIILRKGYTLVLWVSSNDTTIQQLM